jgi:hypothetical protein
MQCNLAWMLQAVASLAVHMRQPCDQLLAAFLLTTAWALGSTCTPPLGASVDHCVTGSWVVPEVQVAH